MHSWSQTEITDSTSIGLPSFVGLRLVSEGSFLFASCIGMFWMLACFVYWSRKQRSMLRVPKQPSVSVAVIEERSWEAQVDCFKDALDDYVIERGCSDDFHHALEVCADEMLQGHGSAMLILADRPMEHLGDMVDGGSLIEVLHELDANLHLNAAPFQTLFRASSAPTTSSVWDRQVLEQVAQDLHLDGVSPRLAKLENQPKNGAWSVLGSGIIVQAAADLRHYESHTVVQDNSNLRGSLPTTAMGTCDHLKSHGIPAVIFCRTDLGGIYAVFVPSRAALLSGEDQLPQIIYIDLMCGV